MNRPDIEQRFFHEGDVILTAEGKTYARFYNPDAGVVEAVADLLNSKFVKPKPAEEAVTTGYVQVEDHDDAGQMEHAIVHCTKCRELEQERDEAVRQLLEAENALAALQDRHREVVEKLNNEISGLPGLTDYGRAQVSAYVRCLAFLKPPQPNPIEEDISNVLMDARWDGRYQDYCRQGARAVVGYFKANPDALRKLMEEGS